jgi:hypothetical protein
MIMMKMMMMIKFRLCDIDIKIEFIFINLVSFVFIHKKLILFPGPKNIEIESLN